MSTVFGMRVSVLPEPVIARLIKRLKSHGQMVGEGKGEANMVIDERHGIIYVTERGQEDLRRAIKELDRES